MKAISDWAIETDGAGGGKLKRLAAPRFTAVWTVGDADLTAITGGFWRDEGDGEAILTLHNFEWADKPPGYDAFSELMDEAVRFIDGWIASRF
jgi:hypothetical protein